MIQAAIKGQPWPLSAASYFATNASMNRLANYCSASVCHVLISNFRLPIANFHCRPDLNRQLAIGNELLTGFPGLQLNWHIGVANALSLVSIRLAQLMHLGDHLPELLLINTRQCQCRLILLNASL